MSDLNPQLPLMMPAAEALAACDFITTKGNRAASELVAGWSHAWSSHAAVIWGGSGAGKTHLMNVWRTISGAALLEAKDLADYSRDFVTEFGRNIAVDDADGVAMDEHRERGLFHLYNRIGEVGGGLLLTAQMPPSRWKIQLPDLASRLQSIATVQLENPEGEMPALLLSKLLRDRQLDHDDEVIDYILVKADRTPAALRKLVVELDKLAFSKKRRCVTLPMAAAALEEMAGREE